MLLKAIWNAYCCILKLRDKTVWLPLKVILNCLLPYFIALSDRYILNYGIVSKAIWVPTNCALLYWCDKELSDISYQSVCTPLRNADKNIITYPCLVYTTSLMAARTEYSHIVSNSSHYTFMIQLREDEIPISKGMQIGSSINASVWWN